jgi:hypothetical protein
MFDLRLISADALKLRRRRGMIALCLALTLGVVALVFAVTGIQHASNPGHYGPAGGLKAFQGAMLALTMLMLVVGVIVGATAGAQDLESGVFRDLAATGRSRLALFGARIPGAWAIVLPIAALASAAVLVGSFALAGGLPTPDAATIAAGIAGVLAAGALSSMVSVGLAALVGSKAPVIATVLAFVLAISPLLSGIGFLGDARMAIPTNALARIGDQPDQTVQMGLVTAIVVVLAWAAAAFAAGAWKTRTREI